MRHYTGPAPCPGCQQPGTTYPRRGKDELCDKCKDFLNLWKELSKDFDDSEYHATWATWYGLEFYNDAYNGKQIDDAFRDLLKALHRNVKASGEWINLTKTDGTTHTERYVIKKEYAFAIKKLVDALEKQQADYHEQMKQVEVDRAQVIKKERNKLYNEGVKYGRSLLVQLNRGEITLADLEETVS